MYKLICVDERYSKRYKTYFGEGAIDKFFDDIIKESEYCSKVIEKEFEKPLAMTKKDHEDFKSSNECWIFKKTYEEGEVEVKDHHITGKNRASRMLSKS